MIDKFKKYIGFFFILVIISLLIFMLNGKKTVKSVPVDNSIISSSSVLKKSVDTSTWTKYLNDQLGFSIKIPPEVPTLYRCPDKQKGNTPLKVYEDNHNGVVYISAEYYYDANWSQPEQKFIGSCDKITYSLKSLESGENNNGLYIASNQKPFLGWKIVISNAGNDADITKYIKENFGSGCIIRDMNSWNQDGVYDVKIYGEDWDKEGSDLGTTTCPVNFQYKIFYFPEKRKLMSVVTGQECTFGTDPLILSSYQCYDDEMIKSFKFE